MRDDNATRDSALGILLGRASLVTMMWCDPFSRNDPRIKDGRLRPKLVFDNLVGVQVQFLSLRCRDEAVHSKKSILRMKTAFIDCAEANFLFVVAICIVLS
jgi:hypothetical protein